MPLPPLSLYIHVPWCVRKCPYCDFNSHAAQGELPEAEYCERLLTDLQADLPYVQGRPLQSIFIGGGTPSLFSGKAYQGLLQNIATRIPFADDIEITLEANPGTVELERFSAYREAGINRLSIGVQSFNAEQLQTLGRIHNQDEALTAAACARQAGFDNFNLDLMFALPGQTTEQACHDLQTAIDCKPTHLSWYQLTIEPNTEFFSRPPTQPVDDQIAEMQSAGIALLAEHGFQRYEISAYAQQGKHAQHNINYWQFGDYLGIGAGAHGKITQADEQRIVRTRKTRMPQHYLDKARSLTTDTKTLRAEELPLEFMMNALRLCEGVPAELFSQRTGIPSAQILNTLQTLRHRQLLTSSTSDITTTALGLQHLNEVLLEFM